MQSCRRMEFELLLFIFSAARNGILAMENLCNVPIRVIETRFSSFFFSLSLLFHWDITIIWNRVNQDGWDKSLIRFFIEMYLLILSPVNLRSKWEASRSCCSKLYRFFAEELEEKETRSRCGDFRVDDSLIIYPEIFEVESRHPGGTETPCIAPEDRNFASAFRTLPPPPLFA